MKQLSKLSFHALVLALVFTGVAAHAGGFGNNIAVRLVGTSELFIGDELFEDFGLEPKGALCYDVDLVNVRNGKIIGSATDCLTDIDAESGAPGVALTGTTFFFFRGGTVVTRGLTTVQPVLHGSPDFTHITGAIPQEGDNNVIYGDRKFKHVRGTARLSGAVNLVNFPDEITFDCAF
ncbi:MAG: hypothetical protein JSW48_02850, partial [Betaproteobacteria bacterium]